LGRPVPRSPACAVTSFGLRRALDRARAFALAYGKLKTFSLPDSAEWPVPHARSRQLFERARKVEAGGAQGEGRGYRPYPLYIDRADGARMWDVDGNEYVDFHAAFSCILLGHNHPAVRDAVIETIQRRGCGFSAAHELEIDLAYQLRELIPSAEMVAFSCTGSEATYHAIRLARAVTGRNKLLKFEGCYHGWHDAVAWSTHFAPEALAGEPKHPLPVPATSGAADGSREAVVVRQFNDADGVRSAFEENPGEIAALILDPIAVNAGVLEPEPGFLEACRELCSDAGALLIFDEVITGFRVAPGGAQEIYGIVPDLTTLGKAMANGLPLSALVGKEEYMSRLATAGDVLFSGTHCGHIVNVAAGLACLDVLRSSSVHSHVNDLGERLAEGISTAIRELEARVQVKQSGSIWALHFTDRPIRTFRDLPSDVERKYAKWPVSYRRWMLARGIYIHPSSMVRGFLTAAHTTDDVDRVVEATREFLSAHQVELREAPETGVAVEVSMD
jgi:glutamate-1-semialdehyde 2,1-aminomutase